MNWRSLVVWMVVSAPLGAAPPVLTQMYPAGGSQGTEVTVQLQGKFERWPVGIWVEGTGIEAKAGTRKGQIQVRLASDAVPGVRWLRVYDDQGASVPRPFVVGNLPEVLERESNDDFRKPQMLAESCVVNGKLERAGDVDCFALKVKKGQTLVASLVANRVLGSPMDGVLQIVSDKGFVLAQNNDYCGLDPQVTYRASQDGTVLVRLFAFPAVPDASIRFASGENYLYRLTITTSGFADYAWPLAVQRGQEKRPVLKGWNLAEEASEAQVVPVSQDLGVAFRSGVAGTALVRLEPHPCLSYIKSSKPQEVAIPATLSGLIDKPGDKHSYAIRGRKGQRLEAILESTQAGFSLDPVLTLRDAAGKQLSRAQSRPLHQDTELSFVFPSDQLYYLDVGDQQGDAGPRHLYRLRLLGGEPDFALSVKSERYTLQAGKSVDVSVSISRRNGFATSLEWVAEGLPAGVRLESESQGKGSTITLRLRAEGGIGASNTAFRIVGKAKTGKGETRVVQARLTEPAATVEWMWLTVQTPPAKK